MEFFKKKTLTGLARTCGWAAKVCPTALSEALEGLPTPADPNLIVGIETADDAAVYRLSKDIAMINTVDFISKDIRACSQGWRK